MQCVIWGNVIRMSSGSKTINQNPPKPTHYTKELGGTKRALYNTISHNPITRQLYKHNSLKYFDYVNNRLGTRIITIGQFYQNDPYYIRRCKIFTTSGNRNIHIRTLHRGQRFNCNLCNKSYTLNRNLALHIKQAHLGEGFWCQHCSKSFRTKQQLSHHLLSHTSEKPHQCDTCNATFKYEQDLKRHIKTLHPSVKIIM